MTVLHRLSLLGAALALVGRASVSPYSITKSRSAAPWRSMPNENMVRPAISSVMRCITSRRSTGPPLAIFSLPIVSSTAAIM